MAFKTKPRDEQASFLTECFRCRGELTISNGRPDKHDCEPNPKFAPNPGFDLEQILTALDNRTN